MRAARATDLSFEVSNPDKVFFPDAGLTKGDLVAYYQRIAPVMLPHVRGRIVAMRRFPDGITGRHFYQKDVPPYFPGWIETVEVEKAGGHLREVVVSRPETLVYLANQGAIELHVWPGRADKPRHPDRLILDLDPSTDDFGPVRAAAAAARERLAAVGLRPYVMTTGSRGLHVVAPLDRRADTDTVRALASLLAHAIAEDDPAHFTVEQRKNTRGPRVFVDYLRNGYGQHAVAPYSVRALPEAPIATPLAWDEVTARLRPRKYTLRNIRRRLAGRDDPWGDIARHARSAAAALRRAERWRGAESVER
ncbi:MAG: non-homologous end-joining DNA ligase [Vicinamibacterales bacterium]